MADSGMTRLAIIADDLSSATDCGAQMVRSGLSVVVPLEGYSLPAQVPRPDVISVDTDSRSLSAEHAYSRVRRATEQLLAGGWAHFYKSVDSTLRGNLGAEVEAVMEAVKPDCAIVAPAFPKYGRTTVNGVQYLQGRPLHETEFGTDPTAPVRDADIARRLKEGSSRKTGRMILDQVRADSAEMLRTVQGLRQQGIELIVVDVAEQEDLKRICLGLAKSDLRIVWVGSTGLAEFIPFAFGVTYTSNMVPQAPKTDPRPALALVGSASETTRAQLRYAEARSGLDIISLDAPQLIQTDSTEFEKSNSKLRAALAAGHNVALVVRSSRQEIAATQQLGATLKLSAAQVAQRIVDRMAQAACGLVREGRLSGIVATGGDTANALCNALGVRALEILGEVEAGIPIMRALGAQRLPLVTKAGGFGSPAAIADALVKVKEYV